MNTSQTIGFITGGQLGRMMIESFLPMRQNETILVLDAEKNCPCVCVADAVFVGSSKDFETVLEFGKRCDTIILEFEHINSEALEILEKMGKKIFCQPKHLKILQHKGMQKKFLQDNTIPTAAFFTVETRKEIAEKMQVEGFEFPMMQKTFLDGYDGGGVKKITSREFLQDAFDAPSMMEKCIMIQREFSLICGRDAFGKTFFYPLVEQFFHSKTHIVDCIVSPAEISDDIKNQCLFIGEKILTAFDGVGMWAIELFEDENGKILVNEIAPRVHNSGHQSIEGNATSQFLQYIKICLGYPAGSTAVLCSAIAWNLLGSENFSGKTVYRGIEKILELPRVSIHLYGKKLTKPNRKMGHLTVTANTTQEAWKKIAEAKKTVRVEAE